MPVFRVVGAAAAGSDGNKAYVEHLLGRVDDLFRAVRAAATGFDVIHSFVVYFV